jgi:TetR/AcrR family transcriptional repressor of nem operon
MFATKFEEMIGMVARLLPEKSSRQARQIATSALATMMGSIVLARAAGDKRLSDDILEAGRQALRSRSVVRRSSSSIGNSADKQE